MNKQQMRNRVVLERLIAYSEEDEDNAEVLADALDLMLDDLRSEDFFGTEGQCDPRGDQRDDGYYDMFNVQGVD